jgi:SAM-dependent methyltransferase
MTRDPEHALSFGQAVSDYERGRPSYPREAVDWIVERAGEARAAADGRLAQAVDVGAGTGKFTASLVAHGLEVTAVEPDHAMLARLATNHPSVAALAGTAEQLPLDDESVDLVTVAQAWHWVDVPVASVEADRVLRPGGTLALVWNIRDADVDWVARLGDIMGSSEAEQYSSDAPRLGPPLVAEEYAEYRWENPLTREELIAMITSRSYVITMDAAERDAMLARVGRLLDTHPQVAGGESFLLPYITRVTLARAPEGGVSPA